MDDIIMESCKMDQPGLYAGFAKVNITPDYPCGLSGYGNVEKRIHEAVVEPIFATCIALTEGDETLLLYTVDTVGLSAGDQNKMREVLAPALGIPGNKIFLAATHCHSAPALYGGYPNRQRYVDDLNAWLLEAGKQALLDRAPATITAGKQKIPGINFVRHYLAADGTFIASNFKDNIPAAHACAPDDILGLVGFVREFPKKDILLVNWQGHPDRSREMGFHNISPSYVGPLRDVLSAHTGCLVAYFTGADGNMNTESRIEEEKHHLNWREYGVKIAQLIYEAVKEMAPVEGAGIVTTRCVIDAEVDHSWDDQVEVAKEIHALYRAEGMKAGSEEARKHNMTSCFQAGMIITRSKMDKTLPVELFAFRVGNVGFISCDYEMFSEAGLYIKENSPYPYTVLMTGNNRYIPSASAFDYRCYEADNGFFVRGTSERLAETMVDMLKEIQ